MQSIETYTLEAGLFSYNKNGTLILYEPDLRLPLTRPLFVGRAADASQNIFCEGGELVSLDFANTGKYFIGSTWMISYVPRASFTGSKIVFHESRGEISRDHGGFDVDVSSCARPQWFYEHRSLSGSQSSLYVPGKGISVTAKERGDRIPFQFTMETVQKRILLFGFLEEYITNELLVLPYCSGYVTVTYVNTTTSGKRTTIFEPWVDIVVEH